MNIKMIKNNITASFAERLRSALMNAGFHSQRSTSGVNILKFAEAIRHTPQICRKYLRGETIPEPQKLTEIAQILNVSPGWLLFGDSHSRQDHENNKITISKNILHHLFSHISQLCSQNNSSEVLPNFWLELTEDLQEFENNEETSKKMIDIALSSFKYLSQNR
jgi:transcriptional regulator with XRE-family HTH domain